MASFYEEEPLFYSLFVTFAGFFMFLSIIVTGVNVMQHLIHYSKPSFQKYIIRIVLISPIYAIYSFLSLVFKRENFALFFDVSRDCYESYVLYCFFKLLSGYLGGEEAIEELLNKKDRQPLTWPVGMFFSFKPKRNFYRICMSLIIQYALIKPLMAILSATLYYFGKYQEANFSSAYLYITIINNISVLVALYSLVLFYEVFKLELNPHSPILKFFVIKMILFAIFWQTVLIYILIWFDVLPKSDIYSAEKVGCFLNDFLVCIEMFIFSIVHSIAFNYDDYVLDKNSTDKLVIDNNMEQGLNGANINQSDSNNSNNHSSSSSKNNSKNIKNKFKDIKYNIKRYKHNFVDGLSDVHNPKDIVLDTIKSTKLSNDHFSIDDSPDYHSFVDLNDTEKKHSKFQKYFKIGNNDKKARPDKTSIIEFDECASSSTPSSFLNQNCQPLHNFNENSDQFDIIDINSNNNNFNNIIINNNFNNNMNINNNNNINNTNTNTNTNNNNTNNNSNNEDKVDGSILFTF